MTISPVGPGVRGVPVDCRLAWSVGLLAALLVLGGCASSSSSTGTRGRFRWPWSRSEPTQRANDAGANRSLDNGRQDDPFLPPVTKPDQQQSNSESKEDVRLGAPRSDSLGVRRPFDQSIQLVSSTELIETNGLTEYCPDLAAIMQPEAAPRAYRHIVLHHSQSSSGSLQLIDQVHREVLGRDCCGFHFVIGNGGGSHDGEIEVSRRWRRQLHGAHLSPQAPAEYNHYGIGICLIGDFREDRPTDRQVAATKALIGYLMKTYGIPAYRVVTHDEVTRDRQHGHRCPGERFRIAEILPTGD